ncbi:MAG: hypothetical protein KAT34_16275 [Candidatus Aminicenantes bacterium]|nr:hypothetical protein [Candidatus Aminicenantes bacterium]
MKKCFKFFIIAVILLGIVFSFSNFMSVEIEAFGGRGTWVLESDSSWICKGDGFDCKPGI